MNRKKIEKAAQLLEELKEYEKMRKLFDSSRVPIIGMFFKKPFFKIYHREQLNEVYICDKYSEKFLPALDEIISDIKNKIKELEQ